MQIVIELESQAPPEGTVTCTDHETPVSFAGWLGLMRVLDEAVAAHAAALPEGQRPAPR